MPRAPRGRLDISDTAIKRAIELSSSSPNADCFTFIKEDFFTWRPTELFDLIFDYLFFCCIEPDMRSAWASQMRDLLKPWGAHNPNIPGHDYLCPYDHVGGPPYKLSIADYEELLHPMGFEAVSVAENKLAVGPRKGNELIGRWKKVVNNDRTIAVEENRIGNALKPSYLHAILHSYTLS
ncbi:Thiol S-methyltransferase [Bertholletia excelsa]